MLISIFTSSLTEIQKPLSHNRCLIFSLIIVFVYFVDIKRSLLTGYALYELHFFFNILFILRVPPIFFGEYFIRFHTGKTEKERERLSTSNSRWSRWDNYRLSPPESQPKYFRKLIVCLLASCPFLWNKNINPFASGGVIALIHLIIIKQEFQLCLNNNHAQTVDPVP